MRPVSLRAPVAVVLAAALLTGCAQSVDPIERLGKKAAQRVRRPGPAREQPYRHWGLTTPLAPAPKPSPRSALRSAGPGLPPVVDRVRTHDRVVFLTYDYDAGAGKDPRFADMVRELRLPVSLFLTDTDTDTDSGSGTDTGAGAGVGAVAGPEQRHLARLRTAGATVQNNTLDRPPLRGLPYAAQRTRICRRQDRLGSRFGARPRLLRPSRGTYDTTTRRAAADCGISALVLWRAAVTAGALAYTEGDHHLGPGDIVLVDPAGTRGPTLRERTARLLRRIQQRGLTVGRLEDYL